MMVQFALDHHGVSYMTLYLITVQISTMNSRSSTHWKLCDQTGTVVPILREESDRLISNKDDDGEQQDDDTWSLESLLITDDERIMRVIDHHNQNSLRQFTQSGQQVWIQDGSSISQTVGKSTSSSSLTTCSDSPSCSEKSSNKKTQPQISKSESSNKNKPNDIQNKVSKDNPKKVSKDNKNNESLFNISCAPYSNLTTQYDHLSGIEDRFILPHYPEPEVANIFKKKGSNELNIHSLESRLRDSKLKRPKAPQVYNQIGNFLRIFGETRESIECFRRALHLSPNHPDVLLNLARVLFNHHYLEDAIYLTRRSLETQPPEKNSWLQHFTLGQILKAYGHSQKSVICPNIVKEAAFHFRHALDLNPGFGPTKAELRELELDQNSSVTYYTLFIICFLVMVVLCGLLTTIDNTADSYSECGKSHRHFNRAMAMKTLKLGLNPKVKMRKCPAINSYSSQNGGSAKIDF